MRHSGPPAGSDRAPTVTTEITKHRARRGKENKMTNIRTWTITGLGLLSLVVGVILAGMAITSAQESSATPTPSATGQAGDDTLTGKLGDDVLTGGLGTDTLSESADVSLTLTNTSLAGLGTDTLTGIEQATLTGGPSANTLDDSAFTGPTTMTGAAGDDAFIGGPGTSRVAESADVSFTLTDSSLTGLGTDSLTGIEQASLTGGASANVIDASAFTGPSTLNGGGGGDLLLGAAGRSSSPTRCRSRSGPAVTSIHRRSRAWSAACCTSARVSRPRTGAAGARTWTTRATSPSSSCGTARVSSSRVTPSACSRSRRPKAPRIGAFLLSSVGISWLPN